MLSLDHLHRPFAGVQEPWGDCLDRLLTLQGYHVLIYDTAGSEPISLKETKVMLEQQLSRLIL